VARRGQNGTHSDVASLSSDESLDSPEPLGHPTDDTPTRRHYILNAADVNRVPVRAILFSVGVVVAVYLLGAVLYRLRTVLLIGLLAGFVALILNPMVVALEHWKIRRRGVAVAVVTVVAGFAFFGLALAFGYPLVHGVTHLANSLPGIIRRTQQGNGWLGHLARRFHVQNWVQRHTAKLTSLATDLGKPALALGKGAASLLLMLFAIFALVVLLLVEAPKIRRTILTILAPERAERYTRIGEAVSRSVSGYMLGNMLTSLAAGVVVFVALSVLGVPYALLWALWVALVDFLPTIGGALAGIPTVLFALAHSIFAGVVTAVVFIIYTQVENHILNPLVMSRTVKINPLLVFISVLVGAVIGSSIGGVFGGFVAVLLAVPIAGSLQVIVQEYWRSSGANAREAEETSA
jgi:predicted PurR-regulated permease PerM